MANHQKLQFYSSSHQITAIILITILYFIFGTLGIYVAIPGTNVSPLWAPAGAALAFVLIFGYRVLPAVFMGSFLVNLMAVSNIHMHLVTIILVSIATGVGASLQAAFGNFLIQRFVRLSNIFANAKTVLIFLFLSIISCFVNSNIGTTSIALANLIEWEDYPNLWLTWLLGDMSGIMVITPLILIWRHLPQWRYSFLKGIEIVCLTLSVAVVALINFLSPLSFMYFFIPLKVWAMLRYQFYGATLVNFIVAIIIVLEGIYGYGLFAWLSLQATLLYIALYISVGCGTVLVVTAELNKHDVKKNRRDFLD